MDRTCVFFHLRSVASRENAKLFNILENIN